MSKYVCKVCGSAYSYCPGCVKDLDKPRWMVSFDKPECKTVFDTLVANTSGKLGDSEALEIVEKSGVGIKNASVLSHVEKLRKGDQKKEVFTSVSQDVTPPVAVTHEEKSEQEKAAEHTVENKEPSLLKKTDEERKEENKSIGSLFGKNNNFSSNSRNKEKVKQDAVAIGSVIGQIDQKNGF